MEEHQARLSIHDARAAALAWLPSLRLTMRLRRRHPDALVCLPSYEWIEINSGDKSPTGPSVRVRDARATAFVWLALSCCAGYSAQENPQFWRDIFRELYRETPEEKKRHMMIADLQAPSEPDIIDDIVQFFPSSERPFPRFMLSVTTADPPASTAMRLFCGIDHIADAERDQNLEALLTALLPFMDVQRWDAATVEWCISTESVTSESVAPLLRLLTPLPPLVSTQPVNGIKLPPFKLRGLQIPQLDADVSKQQQLRALLASECVCVRRLILSTPYEREDMMKHMLWPVLRPSSDETTAATVKALDIHRHKLPAENVAALLSTLPYTTSIDTVRFTLARYPMIRDPWTDMTPLDYAWLGFAIFHPDTVRSSWRHLEFTIDSVTAERGEAFLAMARGNNLLSVAENKPLTASVYYSGRFQAGSRVFSSPSRPATVLATFNTECTVDICVESTDTASYGEYTAVVVPGIGLGWVASQHLLEVTARPAARSSLTRLRVTRYRVGGVKPEPYLIKVLNLLCHGLEYKATPQGT